MPTLDVAIADCLTATREAEPEQAGAAWREAARSTLRTPMLEAAAGIANEVLHQLSLRSSDGLLKAITELVDTHVSAVVAYGDLVDGVFYAKGEEGLESPLGEDRVAHVVGIETNHLRSGIVALVAALAAVEEPPNAFTASGMRFETREYVRDSLGRFAPVYGSGETGAAIAAAASGENVVMTNRATTNEAFAAQIAELEAEDSSLRTTVLATDADLAQPTGDADTRAGGPVALWQEERMHSLTGRELRSGVAPEDATFSENIAELDATMKPNPEPATLYRGVFETDGSIYSHLQPGETITDLSFQSTALDPEAAGNMAGGWSIPREVRTEGGPTRREAAIIEIVTPPGQPMISTVGLNREQEVILPRNTTLMMVGERRIDHLNPKGRKHFKGEDRPTRVIEMVVVPSYTRADDTQVEGYERDAG